MREVLTGVDLKEFLWVDPYLQGLEYLRLIKSIEAEIFETMKLQVAKEEIRAELNLMADRVKAARVAGLKAVLQRFQNREISSITPENLVGVLIAPGHAQIGDGHTAAHDYESLLDPEIVELALKGLPKGTSTADKEARMQTLRDARDKLKEKYEAECWPESRRVFNDQAKPILGRDRWQEVVDLWRKVARPYCEPVDLAGYLITDQKSPAWIAFQKLGITGQGQTIPKPYPPRRDQVGHVIG